MRLHALSYAWSLRVMWQRWQSHRSICHSQKTHATCKLHGAMFYRTRVKPIKVLHYIRIFDLFAPVTLTFTRWPSHTNLTRIPCTCIGRVNMNFLCQGFQKLSSDRQTRLKLYTTPLHRWSLVKEWREMQHNGISHMKLKSNCAVFQSDDRVPVTEASLLADKLWLAFIASELSVISVYSQRPDLSTSNRVWVLYINHQQHYHHHIAIVI